MRIWNYSDQDGINTDMLFPGKYTYTCSTLEEIKPHLLEDLDPDFASNAASGDIIIAGQNFGCGSSREQPALGLKGIGIAAVIAKGFSRIFYRAAINQGLTLIESPEAVNAFSEDSEVSLNINEGQINIDNQTFSFPALPREIKDIQNAGGLLPYTQKILAGKQ